MYICKHIKINSQLNANTNLIKIDLSFPEVPQPSGGNYVKLSRVAKNQAK